MSPALPNLWLLLVTMIKKFRFLCLQLLRVVKMEADQEGVDDMVELAEISEKAIAANLYVRLKKETIYVSAVTLFNA